MPQIKKGDIDDESSRISHCIDNIITNFLGDVFGNIYRQSTKINECKYPVEYKSYRYNICVLPC